MQNPNESHRKNGSGSLLFLIDRAELLSYAVESMLSHVHHRRHHHHAPGATAAMYT
jgi:hypothetical protein